MHTTGRNNRNHQGGLFHKDTSGISPSLPWNPLINGMGVQRSFSTTQPTNTMLKPQYHIQGKGGDEGRARVINRDNNYPNNQRKSEVARVEQGSAGGYISLLTTSTTASPSLEVIIASSCHRMRRTVSECPSEDSFIVFEGCVGEEDSDEDDLDCDFDESDSDSDSDAADNDDDCDVSDPIRTNASHPRCTFRKKVRFASPDKLVVVHHMIMWSFAYRASRRGPWEEYVRDRARFLRRIDSCRDALTLILTPEHREKIYTDRFAPTATNLTSRLAKEESISPLPKRRSGSDHQLIANEKKKHRSKRHRKRRNGKKKRKNRHKVRR